MKVKNTLILGAAATTVFARPQALVHHKERGLLDNIIGNLLGDVESILQHLGIGVSLHTTTTTTAHAATSTAKTTSKAVTTTKTTAVTTPKTTVKAASATSLTAAAGSTRSSTPSSIVITASGSTVSGSTATRSSASASSSASRSASSTTSSASATGTPCSGNSASDRSTWCDYNIDTDYYNEIPDTGVTREYWLELTEGTIAPDGVARYSILVNGTSPGPTLYADWGDNVIVHLKNSLTTASPRNGTTMHFHGIRQRGTNQYDGVSGITQCPTPPGSTITYKWRAEQYGHSWYHSHFDMQPWDGFYGGIIINGPSTANYDEDLGMLFLSDWDHRSASQLLDYALNVGVPVLDTGLINGTNVNASDATLGHRYNTTVTSGKSYRIRLISVAIDTHFKFSIDNHTLNVMATDFVPIVPWTTEVINIGMGQRYDLVITADQGTVADNFWIRSMPQITCSSNSNSDNIRGILSYTTPATPNTTAWDYVDSCVDEDISNLVPHLAKTAGTPSWVEDYTATAGTDSTSGLILWFLNSTSFSMNWDSPTLLEVLDNATEYGDQSIATVLNEENDWNYLIIHSQIPAAHPIHLHGHDFYVLAQGTGTFNTSATLNLSNPPRRDVAMLVPIGYLVIGWQNDNPGTWLAHCHIGTHTGQGLAMQFVERKSEIAAITDTDYINDNCNAWNEYMSAGGYEQTIDMNGI